MTKFSVDDLPPHMRRQVSAKLAEQIKVPEPERQPAAEAPMYRCHTCGFEARWTMTADGTPAAIRRHTAETGHIRWDLQLYDGPPPDPA